MWARHGMLQERTTSICRTPGRALAQGTDYAHRTVKNIFCSFCQSYREKSCLSFALYFPPRCTPRPATQAQAGGQLEPPGWGWSLQEDCDFSPARSSQPYLSLLSELLPNVSMGWKSHRAHISILKAVVGLWVDISNSWRCEDAIADICTLRLLLRTISHWALGWVCNKDTQTLTYTHTQHPQPLTHLQPLDTTLRDCKPWVLEERKGFSAPQLSWRLRKTVRYYKHEEETNFWVVCPFCSYFVLLLVDITFSAQQECILPFLTIAVHHSFFLI